jgi:hypothetical protein
MDPTNTTTTDGRQIERPDPRRRVQTAADPTSSMRRRVALFMARPITFLTAAIAEAARLAEAQAALERRCAVAAQHARPTCIRVVAGPAYPWRLDRPLLAVERLHDCGGSMTFDLPDDACRGRRPRPRDPGQPRSRLSCAHRDRLTPALTGRPLGLAGSSPARPGARPTRSKQRRHSP